MFRFAVVAEVEAAETETGAAAGTVADAGLSDEIGGLILSVST